MSAHNGLPGTLLSARVHRGLQAFDTLRQTWQAAVDQAVQPSLFITPAFIELSWQHFSQTGDEPWLVSVHNPAGELVGLLPLALCTEYRHRFPLKVLRHIGAWSGDRSGVLHLVEAARVWQVALEAVLALRQAWHRLDLRELDEDILVTTLQTAKAVGGVSVSTRADTYAGVLPITGTWDDYFRSRSKNTRQAYRRSQRLLEDACPDLNIEVIEAPEQMNTAFERYVAIERIGWKSGAKVGLWADPREAEFHRALLPRLAATGQASVWMLRSGTRDIAGLVRLRQGPITYERYSTYDPEFARCSPGTWLCMEAVRRLFGTDCTRSDALGLHEPLANRPAIGAWYDTEHCTTRLVVTREMTGLTLLRQSRNALQAVRDLRPSRWHAAGAMAASAVTAMAVLD